MAERARTALTGIVLVNWKGVFFQDYRLNPTITALEGVNGAGKTTVMVAAFVALFPDQRWLDFENVAVSGKQRDRGIAGRLGRPGPSWAVLDVQPSRGGRCLAGVHLQRGAEGQVGLEPFLVCDVPPQADIQELLLIPAEDGRARVPDPVDLDRHLGRRGLGLKRLDPQRYFEELFERGVLSAPLRAAADRQRFFELLQTSLMGGLSDKVRRGLREYLLREDSSVAGVVKRMQENLAACRATREQLDRFEQIQQRIGAVHDAGQEMFALGVHATRRRAEELEQKAREAQEVLTRRQEVIARARSHRDETGILRQQAAQARAEAEQARTQAEVWFLRVQDAHRLAGERDLAQARLEAAEAELHSAEERLRIDRHHEQEAGIAQDDARSRLDALSSRKAEQARAWEEVSRKVGRYRQALDTVEAARRLGGVGLPAESGGFARALPALREEVSGRLTQARAGTRTTGHRLAEAAQAAEDWRVAREALAQLVGEPIPAEDAHARAQATLALLDDGEREIFQLPQLQRELRDLEDRLRRQQAVANAAARLAHPLGPLTRAATIRLAYEQDSAAHTEAEHRRDARDQQILDSKFAAHGAESRCRQIEADARSWLAAQDVARALGLPPRAGAVQEALSAAEAAREACADALRAARVDRADLERERIRLETAGRARDPRLDAVAAQVGGRVLLELLDDTPAEDAAMVEARLGPDIDGVVVDDPRAAARIVASLKEAPDQVVLLPTAHLVTPVAVTPFAVVVEDAGTLRVTRLPGSPVVGEAARRERIGELGRQIAALDVREEEHCAEEERLRIRCQRLYALRPEAGWLDREDPRPELDRERAAVARALAQASEASAALVELKQRIQALRVRRTELERLLPEAALLDQPTMDADVARVRARISALNQRQNHLTATAIARKVLRQRLDALRSAPLSGEALTALRASLEVQRAEVERLDTLDAALRVIDPEALGWGDQEQILAGRQAILESLNAEEQTLKKKLAVAKTVFDAMRATVNESMSREAAARGERTTAERLRNDLQGRLDALHVPDPGAEALKAARLDASRASVSVVEADQQHTRAVEADTQAGSALDQAEQEGQAAQAEATRTRSEADPWISRWLHLRDTVETAGMLPLLTAARWVAEADRESGVNLSKRATEVRRRLELALKTAGEAEALLRLIDRDAEPDEGSGRRYLELWLEVRRWVLDRVPREVSESDEPGAALASLGQRIASLCVTLARDEKRLRTDAGEIARGIHSRYDREKRRMLRLNRDLAGAGFGSIEGMRVQITWRDHMRRLLETLQDQRTLFRADLPLDEAMAEIYRAQGGGKVKGQQLLDYREYLDLDLQIRRRGEDHWRSSRDQGVSTGEAIGVGAAVLMVVLSAWEEDYRLSRAAQGVRSLRFLFLDEASRLSPDSLTVLFDLCRRMEIQMLVAAPHVPPEPGALIYRLVRGIDDSGQDVVAATGRRFVKRA